MNEFQVIKTIKNRKHETETEYYPKKPKILTDMPVLIYSVIMFVGFLKL